MIEYPSFWPRLSFGELQPIVTSKKILMMLDCREQVSPDIAEGLLRLGFQASEQREGRWISPNVVSADDFWKVGGIRANEEPYEPDRAIYLGDISRPIDRLPVEIRQGIAWWMSNDPSSLLGEIKLTVQTLPADVLEGEVVPQSDAAFSNMERLREWVGLALQGEITPVTEPIISMGLTKALAAYPDSVPPELNDWLQRLREFRGEPAEQVAQVDPPYSPVKSPYPSLQSLVQWRDEAGRIREGTCLAHAEDDGAVWVMTEDPVWIGGMPLVGRELIKLERLVSPEPEALDVKNEATKEQTADAANVSGKIYRFEYPAESIEAEIQEELLSLWKRKVIEVAPFWHVLDADDDLDPDDYLSSGFVSNYSALRAVFQEQKEIRQQWLLGRINDDWNRLQEYVPDALQGVLSVMPVLTSTASAPANPDEGVFYGVSLHPKFATEYLQRLQAIFDSENKTDGELRVIRKVVSPLIYSSSGSRLPYGDSRRLLPWPQLDHRQIQVNHGFWEREESVWAGSLYRTPYDVGEALRNRFAGNSDDYGDLAAKNERVLDAVASLVGDVKAIRHPVIALGDMLSEKGIWPSDTTLGRQLAMLGVDLSVDTKLPGEFLLCAGFGISSCLKADIEKGLISVSCRVNGFRSGEPCEYAGSVVLMSERMTSDQLAAISAELNVSPSRVYGQVEMLSQFVQWQALGMTVHDDLAEIKPFPLLLDAERATSALLTPSSIKLASLSAYTGGLDLDSADQTQNEARELVSATTQSLLQVTDITPDDQDVLGKTIDTMLRQNKHIGQFSERGISRIKGDVLSNLYTSEIVILQYSAGSRNLRWVVDSINLDEIEKTGFDRAQAVEKLKMKMSARRGMGRAHYLVFDRLAIARPEQFQKAVAALAAQNEVPFSQPFEVEKGDEDGGSGKRGDTGIVYGFSVKDLRRSSREVVAAIEHLTPEQRKKWVTKNKLWPAPSWVDMRQAGEHEPAAGALIQILRAALPSAPASGYLEGQSLFADVITTVRDWCERIKTAQDIEDLKDELIASFSRLRDQAIDRGLPTTAVLGEIGKWVWDDPRYNHGNFSHLFLEKVEISTRKNTEWPNDFGVSSKGRGVKQTSEVGALPMLEKIERIGPDYRKGVDATEEDLIKTFGFSGIEYGVSMPQKERTLYLNYAYDAFADLASMLNVPAQALSLGGVMGLAFGSRGRGGRGAAIAHFEPSNMAINLTRMKGAGSMGHEYGHALSNYFFRQMGQASGDPDMAEFIGEPKIYALHDDNMMGLRKEIYNAFVQVMAVVMREKGREYTYHAQVRVDAAQERLTSALTDAMQTIAHNALRIETSLSERIELAKVEDDSDLLASLQEELEIIRDFRAGFDSGLEDLSDHTLVAAKEVIGFDGLPREVGREIADQLAERVLSYLIEQNPRLQSLELKYQEELVSLHLSLLFRTHEYLRQCEYLKAELEKEADKQSELEKAGDPGFGMYGRPSLMLRSAMVLDGKKAKRYWSSPSEMFARAFETWLVYAFKQSGERNDYLVRMDKMKYGDPVKVPTRDRYQLYPESDRMPEIDAAFRNLFQQIKIQQKQISHPVLGNAEIPVMYSRDVVYRQDKSTRALLAQCALTEIARMCGPDVAVEWRSSLKDKAGKPIAGSFQPLADRLCQLIRFAEDAATMDTVYHEAFHYAQRFLLSKDDLAVLDYEFSVGHPLHDRLIACLQAQGKSHLIEELSDPREAQAYAYQEWVAGRFQMSDIEQPKSIFGVLRRFFNAIIGVRDDYGFRSSEQIFRAFYDGRFAPAEKKDAQLKNVARDSLNDISADGRVIHCHQNQSAGLSM